MKRGQAALEFLSTYGFAFLIILVMIGALTYFGVLNPSRFLPERCLVGQEFECRDHFLDGTPGASVEVAFILANNIGNSVTFQDPAGNASISIGTGVDTATCSPSRTTVAGGETVELNCTINSIAVPAEGEKVKVQLDLIYTEVGGAYPHPIKGEIFATLQ